MPAPQSLAPPPFLRSWAPPGAALQAPADAAVVIPTTLRATLAQALASVFAQDFPGRIHVLLGIDIIDGPLEMLDGIAGSGPSHCLVQALYPGYSTSTRHGGLCAARDGGALRTVCSYLANAPRIAYLDDDNWWHPRHLATLARSMAAADWAFAQRWFVHPSTGRPICIDRWESVGPGAGIFQERFGGFVDPNCLMLNRMTCAEALPWWTVPLPNDPKGMSADRHVFEFLRRQRRGAATGEATTFYRLDPQDGLHPLRLRLMGEAYDRAGGVEPAGPA